MVVMTPDELEKEAERIITDMDCDSCQSSSGMRKQMTAIVLNALRSVHNAAIEKAATVAAGALVNHSHVFRGAERTFCDTGFSGERNECVLDLIRALKIGDGK